MKAIDNPFTKIINGTTQFVIPVFQRDYSWSEDNCLQLWKDILAIADDRTPRGHFLGSVVYISTGDSTAGFTRWQLIDGQQRVTTIMLLLLALRDHILETGWQGSQDGPTAKKIDAYFLQNIEEGGSRRFKLVLRRDNQATLQALLERAELPVAASDTDNVLENYEFFRDRLSSKEVDPEAVYRGVNRLIVVDVTLDRGTDDPQLIFESLNSTGLDLSQSDLIRNFILMRLPEREQTRLYDAYWYKIEALFKDTEKTFDAFIRDFLALKTRASKQAKADDLYFAFRSLYPALGSDPTAVENVLKELLRLAGYHAAFSVGKGQSSALADTLSRLRRLADVPSVLVMRLFERHGEQKMTDKELREAVGLIESFVFRRAVCGGQTRGYWQVFANLAYKIGHESPFDNLKIGLALLGESYAFPDDEQFRVALEREDLYHKRICFALLERLENHGSKEVTDVTFYTIEHVMPQNDRLSAGWRHMLGENWRELQREWLHRLGNLTLTGYNSTYSDRDFQEKMTMPGGFQDSAVRLNKFIRDQEKWTSEQMENRGRQSAQRALSIWPTLEVDQALIAAARRAEMLDRAARRDLAKMPMSPEARQLFEIVRKKIEEIDANVIQIVETKSISYHDPEFFLEVLPRKRGLTLLLAIDFNEIEDLAQIAQDATQRKFLVNAEYEGGVFVRVDSAEAIEDAVPLIRQAYNKSRS